MKPHTDEISDQWELDKIEPLSPESQERIRELTMKKIENAQQEKRRSVKRPLRIAAIAAAAVIVLCGSAFAAYANDWFGISRVFGEKTALVEEDVVSYGEGTEVEATLPSYTEEEQAMIENGTMFVPEQAALAEDSIGASTEDYTFTLEEMLSGSDTLYAVLRVDALSDSAKANMLEGAGSFDGFYVYATNISGTENREKEMDNGALSCTLLTSEESTAYFLISNTGGRFEEGDTILFHFMTETGGIDLFEIPLTHLMDTEAAIELDLSVYEGKGYQWETLTVTPFSLEVNGTYTVSTDQTTPVITVTLTDGTSFELANIANGFQKSGYGTYGTLSFGGTAGGTEDPFMKDTWSFSQAVELSEIASIEVDGVSYTLD